MTWGKQLQFLLDLKRDGMDPQALRDRPVLDVAQAYYVSVFWTLNSSRRFTYGQEVSIPVSEVMAYCQLMYIDSVQEREALLRAIQTLDRAFLKVSAENAKQARPASSQKS